MSGPDYPPGQQFGTNAIGAFAIGISPVGTIKPFDVWKTIISQYANSPRLTAFITTLQDALDQTENLDSFFDKVWNVDTAEGWGLDVWGRIVDVSRVLPFVQTSKSFGFAEAGSASADPFNQSTFYHGDSITTNYRLTDDVYRKVILAKALANICDGSIPAINGILRFLFAARGNAYVTEGQPRGSYFGFAESENADGFNQSPLYISTAIYSTYFLGFAGTDQYALNHAPFYSPGPAQGMTMTYTFEFLLTPTEVAIVTASGILPKPVGVTATIVQHPN